MPRHARAPRSPNKAYEGEPAVWRMPHVPVSTSEALEAYGFAMEQPNTRPQFSPAAWTHFAAEETSKRTATAFAPQDLAGDSIVVSVTTAPNNTTVATTATATTSSSSPSQSKAANTFHHPAVGSRRVVHSVLQMTDAPNTKVKEWGRNIIQAPPSPVLSAHAMDNSEEESAVNNMNQHRQPRVDIDGGQLLSHASEISQAKSPATIKPIEMANVSNGRDGKSLSPSATRDIRAALREKSANIVARNVHSINLSNTSLGNPAQVTREKQPKRATSSPIMPLGSRVTAQKRSSSARRPISAKLEDAYLNTSIVPDTSSYAKALESCTDDLLKQQVAAGRLKERTRQRAVEARREVLDTYTRVYRSMGKTKSKATNVDLEALQKKRLELQSQKEQQNISSESTSVGVQCDPSQLVYKEAPEMSSKRPAKTIATPVKAQQVNGLSNSDTSTSQHSSPSKPAQTVVKHSPTSQDSSMILEIKEVEGPVKAEAQAAMRPSKTATPGATQPIRSPATSIESPAANKDSAMSSYLLYKQEMLQQRLAKQARDSDANSHPHQRAKSIHSQGSTKPPLSPTQNQVGGSAVVAAPLASPKQALASPNLVPPTFDIQQRQTPLESSTHKSIADFPKPHFTIGGPTWGVTLRPPILHAASSLPASAYISRPDQLSITTKGYSNLNGMGEFVPTISTQPRHPAGIETFHFTRPLRQPRRAPYAAIPSLDAKGIVVGPIVPFVALEERVRLRSLRGVFAVMRRIAQYRLVSESRTQSIKKDAFNMWRTKASVTVSLDAQAIAHHEASTKYKIFTIMKVRMLARAADECWRRAVLSRGLAQWRSRSRLGILSVGQQAATKMYVARAVFQHWRQRTHQEQLIRHRQLRKVFMTWQRRYHLCKLAKKIQADVVTTIQTIERPKLLHMYFTKWRRAFIVDQLDNPSRLTGGMVLNTWGAERHGRLRHQLFRRWRERLAGRRFMAIGDGQRGFWLMQLAWFAWRAKFETTTSTRSVRRILPSTQIRTSSATLASPTPQLPVISPYTPEVRYGPIPLRPMISPYAMAASAAIGSSRSPLTRSHSPVLLPSIYSSPPSRGDVNLTQRSVKFSPTVK